jgi:uncharacterized protein (TIGR02145 family)
MKKKSITHLIMRSLTNLFFFFFVLSLFHACKKEDSEPAGTTVTDVEGNIYKTVIIGNQTWMTENLKTTKYNDNTPIANITDTAEWARTNSPALSWYSNDELNKAKYGALYNWFALSKNKLCPTGWHVPSDAEWNTLELYLGLPPEEIDLWGWRGTTQGAQLKSQTEWLDPSGVNTNTSGFSALPGGYRHLRGSFNALGVLTIFWTSTDDSLNNKPNVAWYRRLDDFENKIYKATTSKSAGQYIRCVKN